MKTHTIRWNGDKTHRIVTFTQDFEKMLLEKHPQAATMLIDRLLENLARMTGNKHRLDSDQTERMASLMQKCNELQWSTQARLLNGWIYNGLRIEDADLTDILKALSYFYEIILKVWKGHPATEKQISYLKALGFTGDVTKMTKEEASEMIGDLKDNKQKPTPSQKPSLDSYVAPTLDDDQLKELDKILHGTLDLGNLS